MPGSDLRLIFPILVRSLLKGPFAGFPNPYFRLVRASATSSISLYPKKPASPTIRIPASSDMTASLSLAHKRIHQDTDHPVSQPACHSYNRDIDHQHHFHIPLFYLKHFWMPASSPMTSSRMDRSRIWSGLIRTSVFPPFLMPMMLIP